MASPYLFGAPYYDSRDGFLNIDPSLQSHDQHASLDHWALHNFLKDPQQALFSSNVAAGVNHHRNYYPPPAVSGPASHYRLASPISSIEPSSASGTAHSPLAESEPYLDPSTPPEIFSPYPRNAQHIHLNPDAHALQFRTMGPQTCVNPAEVSPNQQHDANESDGENITFELMPPSRTPSWDRLSVNQFDHEPSFPRVAKRMSSSDGAPALIKDEVKVVSQYPPLPAGQDADSDEDSNASRSQKHRLESDGTWVPDKRYKTNNNARPPPRPRGRGRPPRPMPDSQRPPPPTLSQMPTRPLPAAPRNGPKTTYSCSEPGCRQKAHFADQLALEKHIRKEHRRGYTCVFHFAGCESTFASKNEWKRHVSSQHLLLNYWICQEDECANTRNGTDPIPTNATAAKTAAPSQYQHQRSKSIAGGTKKNIPNGAIFNRKDLYTQHMRRMHMPENVKKTLPTTANKKSLTTAGTSGTAVEQWDDQLRKFQDRALRSRCSLPEYMTCPAVGCNAEFRGSEAWDQRMEHVARHLDRAAQGSEPSVVFGGPQDTCLTAWAGSPEVSIIEPTARGWRLKAPSSGRGRGLEGRAKAEKLRLERGVMVRREKMHAVVEDSIVVGSEEDAEGEVDVEFDI